MKLSLFVVLAMAVSASAAAPSLSDAQQIAVEACCFDATFNNAVVGVPAACYATVPAALTGQTVASLNTACGTAANAAAVSVACQRELASVMCGDMQDKNKALPAGGGTCTTAAIAAGTDDCEAMLVKNCCNDPLFNDAGMVAGISTACYTPVKVLTDAITLSTPTTGDPMALAVKTACTSVTAAGQVPAACEGALAKPICGQPPASLLATAAVAACCTAVKATSKFNDGTAGVSAACFIAVGAIFDSAPGHIQVACGYVATSKAAVTAPAVSVKCESAVAKGMCGQAAFVPVPVSPVKADSTSVAVSAAVMALSAASALMA